MGDQRCQEEYIRRIQCVQDYIEQHLGSNLQLETLAAEAGFSKYHFSRIFQGIVKEPLAHYVMRLRMESALFLLAHRPDKGMTEIAYELGFSDSSVFSRAFKQTYGISPREYRKAYSKNCKEPVLISKYNKEAAQKAWGIEALGVKAKITIETLKEQPMIYVRHIGDYESLAKAYRGMVQKLLGYAKKHQLLEAGKNKFLAMYHANPEFGEEEQFRTSLCMTLPEKIALQEDDVVGKMMLEGGLYAVGRFRIHQQQYSDAWDYMYQEWLGGSGYEPRNACPFEVYCNDPEEDVQHMHEVAIYVPIEPIHF